MRKVVKQGVGIAVILIGIAAASTVGAQQPLNCTDVYKSVGLISFYRAAGLSEPEMIKKWDAEADKPPAQREEWEKIIHQVYAAPANADPEALALRFEAVCEGIKPSGN